MIEELPGLLVLLLVKLLFVILALVMITRWSTLTSTVSTSLAEHWRQQLTLRHSCSYLILLA